MNITDKNLEIPILGIKFSEWTNWKYDSLAPETTFIYALTDPRSEYKFMYVGKTDDIEDRLRQHVTRICEKTAKIIWIKELLELNLFPNIVKLAEVKFREWAFYENYYYYYYKDLGYTMVQDEAVLGLGGHYKRIWTKENCMLDALKYKIKSEWRLNSKTAYEVAQVKGWLEECCEHMEKYRTRKGQGYWTPEKCKKESIKYLTVVEWRDNSKGSYCAAYRLDCVEECTKHMKKIDRPMWHIKENCIKEAKKYNTRNEWRSGSPGSYDTAHKKGWGKECSEHMVNGKIIKWTFEACKKEALKFKTIKDWRTNSASSYVAAGKRKWLKDCEKHMIEDHKHKGHWTKENCLKEALLYTTIYEWRRKSPGSKSKAMKNGWYDECIKHMFTLESCKKDALKYKSRNKWRLASKAIYSYALKYKWLNECCKHMSK